MEEQEYFLSLGYEGLSFIEIERGEERRCDLCVVRWSAAAAGVVWMKKILQNSGVESCMLKEHFFDERIAPEGRVSKFVP